MSPNICLSGYELLFSEKRDDLCSRVMLAIREDVAFVCHHVPPDMTNEYVATTVWCGKTTFTVIAGYIPPSVVCYCHRLDAILQQTPPPYGITGDFNAHHPSWGSNKTTTHGRTLVDLAARHGLMI